MSKREARRLAEIWTRLMGEAPSQWQFERWLYHHLPNTIEQAIVRTSKRAERGDMSLDFMIRYCSKLCNDETFELFKQHRLSDATRHEEKGAQAV